MQQPNTAGLVRLSDADDLNVAEGNEDVRGWEIRDQSGEKIGEVKDLLVDQSAMKVRYLDAELGGGIFSSGRRVLIPVGVARLDERDDAVLLSATAAALQQYPEYDGSTVSRDYETSLRRSADSSFEGTHDTQDFYGHAHYEERGIFGSRRTGATAAGAAAGATGAAFGNTDRTDRDHLDRDRLGADQEARVVRSEEELSVGTRQVQAGEAYLRKRVETEQVHQNVAVTHEEVEIERRPLGAGASMNATITDDEIRIPLMAEEVVVEKRIVPKEEIVIRKHAVQEEQVVDETLRRERVDVDDASVRAGTTGRTDTTQRLATDRGTSDHGVVDRLGDKLDDLKDRVDGNPASRPGRDATDAPHR